MNDARPTLLLLGQGEPLDDAVRRYLKQYRVIVESASVADAVLAVTACAPDLVVLWGDAAKDGGTSVLEALAGSAVTSLAPVALVLDDASLGDRLMAFRSGAVAVIPRSASADAIAKRMSELIRELPNRPGEATGALGEATFDELVQLVSRKLRSGIVSVEGAGDEAPVRLMLGTGKDVARALDAFVAHLAPLVADAKPLRYELFETAGGRLQLGDEDFGASSDQAVFQNLRVLIMEDDPQRADGLAQSLRDRGAQVAVTDFGARGLERARKLDPAIVVLDAGAIEGAGFDTVRRIRRDARLRWASLLVARWDELWPKGSASPDLDRVASRVAPLVQPDREVEERASKDEPFDTRLELTGPSRLLRAIARVEGTRRISAHASGTSIDADLADGLVVGAKGTHQGIEVEGNEALTALLSLSAARVRIERRAHAEAANVMLPVDEALDAALAGMPSEMTSSPAPPLVAHESGPPQALGSLPAAMPESVPRAKLAHASTEMMGPLFRGDSNAATVRPADRFGFRPPSSVEGTTDRPEGGGPGPLAPAPEAVGGTSPAPSPDPTADGATAFPDPLDSGEGSSGAHEAITVEVPIVSADGATAAPPPNYQSPDASTMAPPAGYEEAKAASEPSEVPTKPKMENSGLTSRTMMGVGAMDLPPRKSAPRTEPGLGKAGESASASDGESTREDQPVEDASEAPRSGPPSERAPIVEDDLLTSSPPTVPPDAYGKTMMAMPKPAPVSAKVSKAKTMFGLGALPAQPAAAPSEKPADSSPKDLGPELDLDFGDADDGGEALDDGAFGGAVARAPTDPPSEDYLLDPFSDEVRLPPEREPRDEAGDSQTPELEATAYFAQRDEAESRAQAQRGTPGWVWAAALLTLAAVGAFTAWKMKLLPVELTAEADAAVIDESDAGVEVDGAMLAAATGDAAADGSATDAGQAMVETPDAADAEAADAAPDADAPDAATAPNASTAPDASETPPTVEPDPSDADPDEFERMSSRERDRVADRLAREAARALREDSLPEAFALIRRALRADERNPHAIAARAQYHLAAGEGAQALEWARRAVGRRGRRAAYRILLGDALAATGDASGAQAEWRRALELEPDNRTARARLR